MRCGFEVGERTEEEMKAPEPVFTELSVHVIKAAVDVEARRG